MGIEEKCGERVDALMLQITPIKENWFSVELEFL